MTAAPFTPVGSWLAGPNAPAFTAAELLAAVPRVREQAHVVRGGPLGALGVGFDGEVAWNGRASGRPAYPLVATLPALFPEWLGDRGFCEIHGTRFPYLTGAMANGIATPALVIAIGKAGMLGFFGAAGLSPARVEQALTEIEAALGTQHAWGSNLIHSPNEPDLEDAIVDLYLRRAVKRVDASAYMNLTPSVVRYAASGLRADASGRVRRANRVLAKISRPEVARRFLQPAPAEMLDALVASGRLSRDEARLAVRIPLAEDVTVESDSGGHTDNRPLGALFPTIAALRDECAARHGYHDPIRIGAAGGLGTPAAVASAFALGAAYVMTGTINQASLESGLSENGKRMLAEAGIADVIMAPAADMFELGVKVQVLRRGTMFAVRAARLYELYTAHSSWDEVPQAAREKTEKEILRGSFQQVWDETRRFFEERDPREVARAEREPRHKMALVFRWYLGKSSKWSIAGDPERRVDYQIWCGPAMGAFNEWVRGSFLADPARRGVVQIALNLLEGAAVATRSQQLRAAGVPMPPQAFASPPRPLA
jgi:PfaD family protein